MPALTARGQDWSLGLLHVYFSCPYCYTWPRFVQRPLGGLTWGYPFPLLKAQLGRGLHLSVRGVITSLPLLPRYS